jgi:hypothetical protein
MNKIAIIICDMDIMLYPKKEKNKSIEFYIYESAIEKLFDIKFDILLEKFPDLIEKTKCRSYGQDEKRLTHRITLNNLIKICQEILIAVRENSLPSHLNGIFHKACEIIAFFRNKSLKDILWEHQCLSALQKQLDQLKNL